MSLQPPKTQSIAVTEQQTSEIFTARDETLSYYLRDNDSNQIAYVDPKPDNRRQERILITISGVTFDFGSAQIAIDLASFGIGGILNDKAWISGRDYIAYAIANDSNTAVLGVGAIALPYSLITLISGGGTAPKGSTRDFTVTEGFQFTIDARVVIANSFGVAPLYEWNWGTIVSVSNTIITVVMDSGSYGTSITKTTGLFVKQWNKYKPWQYTSVAQTLVSPNYTLLGEISFNGSSKIEYCYHRLNEFREAKQGIFDSSAKLLIPTLIYFARNCPLWSEMISFFMWVKAGGVIGSTMEMYTQAITHQIYLTANASNNTISTGYFPVYNNVAIKLQKLTDMTGQLTQLGYYVRGGMWV